MLPNPVFQRTAPLTEDELLIVENDLLERYLKGKGVELPSDWTASDPQKPAHDIESEVELEVDRKLQIAIETLSQLHNALASRRDAADKLVSTLKTMLRETELRIGDVQRDAHDLQRDVVEGGGKCARDPDRYQAEKFIRYMEGKLYDQESALDKLRLKNNTLANRKKKLEAQLSREDDSSFHFIDYHQMKIRDKQNKKLLEAKASKVALRKITFEKAKLKVDALQTQLQEVKSKADSNEKAVAMREAYLERLDELIYSKRCAPFNTDLAPIVFFLTSNYKEDEVDGLKNALKNKADPSQILDDEPSGPDVMEAEIYELRETIKAMERKVEIAKGNKLLQKRNSRQSAAEESRPARWTPGML
ncbi:hypothetical protein ACHAWF_001586 [Thalassiosira exigua]